MSFVRFFPLGLDCNALCAGAGLGRELLGGEASLGHTVFSSAYETHVDADVASLSHPALLSYISQIEALQTLHSDAGTPPYRSAYGAPAFGFEASERGDRLFVKHWMAAFEYPLGHALVDIIRLGLSSASRSSSSSLFGPAGPLRTLVLKSDFNGLETVLDRFGDNGPVIRRPEAIYLRYFPLKAPSPVVRQINGAFDVLGYARTVAEARQYAQNTPQIETVSLSDRFQSAHDAIAEATLILNPRWFDVVPGGPDGAHCASSIWLERLYAESRRGVEMAGGGGATRSVPSYQCSVQPELEGSDRSTSTHSRAGLVTVSGELDLLRTGKGT